MNCGGNLPTRLYASVDQKNGKRNLDPFRLEKPGSIEAKTKKDAKRNRTKLTLETSQCEADGRRDLTSDKITNCHIQKRMPSRAFNLRNLNGFLYNGRRWSKRAYVFSRRWPRTNDSRTIFRCPVYIEQLQSSEWKEEGGSRDAAEGTAEYRNYPPERFRTVVESKSKGSDSDRSFNEFASRVHRVDSVGVLGTKMNYYITGELIFFP